MKCSVLKYILTSELAFKRHSLKFKVLEASKNRATRLWTPKFGVSGKWQSSAVHDLALPPDQVFVVLIKLQKFRRLKSD